MGAFSSIFNLPNHSIEPAIENPHMLVVFEEYASAVWSSGMILRLGRRGRRFESANGPFFRFDSMLQANLENDSDGVRTRAGKAHWISSPTP